MYDIYSEFIISTAKYILYFSSIGFSGYLGYKIIRHNKNGFINKNLHQTIEDRSTSTHIIGVQGSGKTYLAMQLFLEDINKGYGALWLSTQGVENSGLLDYIPKDKIDKTILLRPYIDKPLGINLLKTYTNSQLERTLVADSVVTLFKRLFEDFKDNMQGILTAATLALLEYADKTGSIVSLWDLYEFLSNEDYRNQIILQVDNIIAKDMLEELSSDKSYSKNSLDAVLRRMRKLLYHNQIVAFLSQKENDIDLLQAVKQRKIIVCDFLAGGLGGSGVGKENSRFLAELIVSKFQLIAETRNIHSSLYPLYLDEFQTYTTTSDNIRDFIDLNRQRRMPVILINQRRFQLPEALKNAVDSCGTKYIGTLNPNDISHYSKMYPYLSDKINKLNHREFIYDIRSYGKNYDFISKTTDIGKKAGFGKIIEQRNIGKYNIDEIVNNLNEGIKSDINNKKFQ